MARFLSHVDLVRKNTRLLNDVLVPAVHGYPDWVTTVAFYTALHMVEAAVFHDHPRHHFADHTDRNEALKAGSELYQNVWWHYRPLYSLSRVARYLQTGPGQYTGSFAAYLPPNRAVERVQSHLDGVRLATEAIIGSHLPAFRFLEMG